MMCASAVTSELKDLDKQVQRALEYLRMVLQLATYNQGKQMKNDENHEFRNTACHSKAGIYSNPKGTRPKVVTNLKATLVPEGDLVEISWVDQNVAWAIDYLELYFDDETRKILRLSAAQIACSGKKYSIRIGEPHVDPGKLYTFKVRAVNGSGPGEWCESFSFRYKTGPPARPKKPNIIMTSTTEVRFKVKKLNPQEEHGSPVTHCVVEYAEMEEDNEIEWRVLPPVPLKGQSQDSDTYNFNVHSLKPNTAYRFRIIMRNGSGDSVASESKEVITDCLIPGPPHNVQISSKRSATALKVRWSKPLHNPDGVSHYNVQYRLPKDTEWIYYATTPPTEFSTKVKKLETDTLYEFQVQALNQYNQGETSKSIRGETRFGIIDRALLTTGAGIGCTIGGPVVGGVTGGALAALSAEESVHSSSSGKIAASAAAGIGGGIGGVLIGLVGAPFVGIMSAAIINKKLNGDLDYSSPQSSDDESED